MKTVSNKIKQCDEEITNLKEYHKKHPDDIGSLYGLRDWQKEKNLLMKDENSGKQQPFEYDPTNSPIKRVISEVEEEVCRAINLFPPATSAHEQLAIIYEEYLELQTEIFKGKRCDKEEVRKEVIQLAAMALRFAINMNDYRFT